MRPIASVLLLCGLSVGPAFAALSPEEVQEYLEAKVRPQEYRPQWSEVVQILNAKLPAGGPSAAERELAARWKVSSAAAAAVLEAVAVEAGKGLLEHDARIVGLLKSALAEAPDSPELWAVHIDNLESRGGCEHGSLPEAYFAHAWAESQFFSRHTPGCYSWVLDFARLYPMTSEAHRELVEYFSDRTSVHLLAADRWLLDSMPTDALTSGSAVALDALREYWVHLAYAGLADEVLRTAQQLPRAVLNRMLSVRPTEPINVDGEQIESAQDAAERFDTANMIWVLALLESGRRTEAKIFFESFNLPHGTPLSTVRGRSKTQEEHFTHRLFKEEGADRAEFLRDLLANVSPSDPFDRWIGDGETGLLWGYGQRSALSTRASARYLRANGYDIPASSLEQSVCRNDVDHLSPTDREAVQKMPPAYLLLLAHYTELLSASRQHAGCEPAMRAAGDDGEDNTASQLTTYRELPLAQAPRTAGVAPKPLQTLRLPAGFSLVRGEQLGKSIAAISISTAVDPVGEISGGGYWLHRSSNGGKTWEPPRYLGFQEHEPYVVPETSSLPLLNGDVLQLQVDVAELDPSSITFPPVGLALRREAKDLYIELPLSTLERDTDGDGLPDLLEEKLQTDAAKADTDGDGITDGDDDFPQVSARATPGKTAPIVADLLKRITGYDARAVIEPVRNRNSTSRDSELFGGWRRQQSGSMRFLFLESDPQVFAGVRLSGQAIVLTRDQVAHLNARFGPTFPVSLPTIWLNRARTHAVVEWSAGWVGGTLDYRYVKGRWVATVVSEWIT